MKKILLFTIAIAALFLTSCKDFLDVQPESLYDAESYFQNDQQAAYAISKMYLQLRDENFYGQNLFWEEIAANNLIAARAGDAGDYINGGFSTMKYDGNLGSMKDIYSSSYKQIEQANWVIVSLLDKEKKVTLTDVENRTLGEAYFLRGFYHLLMAYRYGCGTQGVPFVAYEDVEGGYKNTIPPQLESVMKNFEYVDSDFRKAEKRLPSINNYTDSEKGRASSESAIAMRVRANAFWATWDTRRWDSVIVDVNKLETLGRKLTTLDKLYSDEPTDYFNTEYCFGIPSKGGDLHGGSWFPICSMPYGPFGCPVSTNTNGWGEFYTSYDLYEEMLKDGVDNDRLKASIVHSGETIQIFGMENVVQDQYQDAQITGFFLNKWNKAFSHADFIAAGYVSPGDGPSNHCFPLIRFAECLLFRAEAYLVKGKKDQAKNDINAVHKRSVGEGAKELSGSWESLYHERRCELCFEGAPYVYNLKRWALSGSDEIKALAKKELETKYRVAVWAKLSSGSYTGTIKEIKDGSYDSGEWAADGHQICMPYPQEELDKSVVDGKKVYKQNPGYN